MSARVPEVVAEFVDRYGDKRVVHRGKNGVLAVKNNESTVALTMNRVAGVEIGKRIRMHREAAGMTLEELCVRAAPWQLRRIIHESIALATQKLFVADEP